jgi:hypothetical protein
MYSMFTSFAKDPGRILHEDCGVKIVLVAIWKCFQGLHIAKLFFLSLSLSPPLDKFEQVGIFLSKPSSTKVVLFVSEVAVPTR